MAASPKQMTTPPTKNTTPPTDAKVPKTFKQRASRIVRGFETQVRNAENLSKTTKLAPSQAQRDAYMGALKNIGSRIQNVIDGKAPTRSEEIPDA